MSLWFGAWFGEQYFGPQWFGDDGGFIPPEPEPDVVTPPFQHGHDPGIDPERVRAWWAEIDRLRAENRAREDAERERERGLEAQRQALAVLERERGKQLARVRTERKRVLRAEIAAIEDGNVELRDAIDEAEDRIVALEAQIAAEQARRELFLRRRQMMLALMLVATQ